MSEIIENFHTPLPRNDAKRPTYIIPGIAYPVLVLLFATLWALTLIFPADTETESTPVVTTPQPGFFAHKQESIRREMEAQQGQRK